MLNTCPVESVEGAEATTDVEASTEVGASAAVEVRAAAEASVAVEAEAEGDGPATDLREIDLDAVEDELVTLDAQINAATFRKLELIRLIDVSERWAKQGAKSCAHWLSWRLQLDPGAAREQVRVARSLVELPRIQEELRNARVTYSQVRAMTRVATPENEERLVEIARYSTAHQLERIVRGVRQVEAAVEAPGAAATEPLERWVRERPMGDGTVRIEAQLMADEATLVMEAIRTVRAAMKAEQRPTPTSAPTSSDSVVSTGDSSCTASTGSTESAGSASATSATDAIAPVPSFADALVRMAEEVEAARAEGAPDEDSSSRVTRTGGERTSLMVHLSPGVLDDGYTTQLADGSHVSAETFRRLACDCSCVTVMEDEHGDPLDVGRQTPSIPPAIRRAVTLRDRGCAFPGCTHDRFVDCHHIIHWAHGGETKKDNLLLLCTFHHRFVHEGGWTITSRPKMAPLITAPDGRVLPSACSVDVGKAATALIVELEDAQSALELNEETALPRWNGRTPDYGLCVEAVGHFDRRLREEAAARDEASPPPSGAADAMPSGTP